MEVDGSRYVPVAVTPRHVLIYGPPAAGKLTVGRALAERCGMVLLDNHLTFDLALRVADFGTPAFFDLVGDLRERLHAGAATTRRDVVSTFVFSFPIDLAYVRRMASHAEQLGVTLHRVHLCPPPRVLEVRVLEASRATTNKVRDLDTLRGVLEAHDLYTSIDESDLRIDNTALSPDEVVDKIVAHLGL